MRPYMNSTIDELEAEFDRARQSGGRATLEGIAHELTFRKTGRAADLRGELMRLLAGLPPTVGQPAPPAPRQNPPQPPRQRPPPQRPPRPSYRPTPEQEEAIKLFRTGGSLRINAYAGTGKTSTLELLAHESPLRGQYLAFNKSIVREAKTRFPTRVDCSTTHSLALQLIRPQFGGDSAKLFNRANANQLVDILGLKKWRIDAKHSLEARSQGALVVSTIQRFAQNADVDFQREHVPCHGSLLAAPPETLRAVEDFALTHARQVWSKMIDRNDPMPLGHDGYLKLWALTEPTIAADYILLDEAQDTNPVVLDVLRRQKSQIVYVGDKYQQIYEWRGAVNAMEKITTDHSSFLTTSFRFGNELAGAATSILKMLGAERPLRGNGAKGTKIVTEGDGGTILARTNASTMVALIEALDAGRRPHLVGGNEELMAMLRGVADLKEGQPSTVPDFFGFTTWKEVEEFARSGEGEYLLTFVNLVEAHGERQLMWALSRTVENDHADVVISTAHKAKGREWPSVQLLDDFMKSRPERRPTGKKSEKPEEAEKTEYDPAELRLLYVAVTRAQDTLIVPSSLFAFLMFGTPPVAEPRPVQPFLQQAKSAAPTRAAPAPVPAAPKPAAVRPSAPVRSPANGAVLTASRPTPPQPLPPKPPALLRPASPPRRGGFLGWLFGR